MRAKRCIYLILAAFGVASCFPTGRLHGAEQKALKLGVVNLTKVFEGYTRKRHLEEELKAIREQKATVLQEKSDEITRLREEIKMLELGSEERKRKEGLLEQKQLDWRNFSEVTATNLLEQKLDVTRTLYEEIAKAVTAYGERENYDLIIKFEDVELESRTIEELLYKINQRVIMFNAEPLDITEEILKIMNDYYSKEIVEK